MKAVVIAFALFVQLVLGSTGGLEGTYFYVCTNLTATVVSAADVHTGNAVGSPIQFSIEEVSGNTMSISTVGGTLVLGLTNSSNGYLQIIDYTSTSLTLSNSCVYPGYKVFCATTSGDTSYMFISDSYFNGPDIVEVNTVTCDYTNLTHSPVNVKGSQSGPGGQCVVVPNQKSIYYLDDATPTLWQYNYSSNTFSNYSMTSDFSAAFYTLFGSDNLDFLVYHDLTSGNAYKIPFSSFTPTIASTENIQDMGVDDSVNPPNLLDFSFGTKIYSFSGSVLGNGPALQTAPCTGAFEISYDAHTTQYGISQTAGAISVVANVVLAAALALFF